MELLLSLFRLFLKPWFAAGLIALLSTLGLAFRRLRPNTRNGLSSKSKQRSSNLQEIITGTVLQVVPIHPHNGWRLEGMWHGLRVFSRSFPSLPLQQPHPHSHASSVSATPSVAASVIINYPPKKALSLAVSTKEIGCWLEGVPPQGIRLLSQDQEGDILKLTRHVGQLGLLQRVRKRTVRFIERYVSFLDGLVAPPTEVAVETIERSWRRDEQFSYLFVEPKGPSSLPYSWSFLMFNALKEQGICLATLVMMPSQQNEEVNSLVAKQLCSLREHATLKTFGVYSTSHQTTPIPSSSTHDPHLRKTESHDSRGSGDSRRKPRSQRIVSEPSIFEQAEESALIGPHPLPRPLTVASEPSLSSLAAGGARATAVLDAKYFRVAEASARKLVAAADGREREGWVSVYTTKDVEVMKKPAGRGEPPINSVKGVGLVKAPPRFISRVLNDPSYTTVLDDMLKESRVLYELSKPLHLVHLLYKGVWPTAPRDFSVLSIQGELDKRTWISSGISVIDPRIPEEKGYVRAQLDVGGYLIRSVPSEPEISEVTYVARVDLKGNIPAFAVNKISQSQPLCVNRLRGLVEPLYAKMKQDPRKMKEFEEKFPISKFVPPKTTPPSSTLINDKAHTSTGEGEGSAGSTKGRKRSDKRVGKTQEASKIDRQASLDRKGASLADGTRVLSRGDSEEKTAKTTSHSSGDGKTTSKTEKIKVKRSVDLTSSPTTTTHTSSKETAKTNEEGEKDVDSTILASTSDSPPNGALPASASAEPVTRKSDHIFSVGGEEEGEMKKSEGEDDQYSLHDSWNGELLETYTPEQLPSDPDEEGDYEGGREVRSIDSANGSVFISKPSPGLQLKLPNYRRVRDSIASSDDAAETQSLTRDTINYPMLNHGGVDFKTMANQTAAKALEEAFHVSSINPQDPSTFTDQSNGWRFAGYDKDVVILSKKTEESPYTSFMGKGVIDLPPQTVFDSIRNPQLRFTYDNMLKELHIVKQVDEGLYILHLHHQTTQCFMKTSRDFCILVSERSEPNKMLLVGTSIDVPECPPTPNVHRGRIFCSGWVVEPFKGSSSTQITYMLQVDVGGLPSSLVNFVSKRQPLAVAYLRDYLVSTSLDLSTGKESSSSS